MFLFDWVYNVLAALGRFLAYWEGSPRNRERLSGWTGPCAFVHRFAILVPDSLGFVHLCVVWVVDNTNELLASSPYHASMSLLNALCCEL